MRIVVTGGRNWRDRGFVFSRLSIINHVTPITRLATGGATGADLFAEQWASVNGVECVKYDAEWKKNGRSAGPIRNRSMLETERPDLVVAFPGGRGTADCVRRAKAMGFKVTEVRP